MQPTLYICNTEFNQRIMELSECEEFFGIEREKILQAIYENKPISKGIRDWYVDEFN